MSLPVAYQLYSAREDAKRDLRGTLKIIKSYGYDGIEFAGLYGHSYGEVREIMAEAGLIPISAHVPMTELTAEKCAETVAGYKAIGCEYIAIPHLSAAARPGGEDFADTLAQIRRIAGETARAGISLLYHNHDFEFIKLNGEYGLDVIYREIPAPLLQAELDTCWVAVAGVDTVDYISKFKGRLPVVHLKDFVGTRSEGMYELIGVKSDGIAGADGKFELRPLGRGVMDIPATANAAAEAGACWFVVEQDAAAMGLSALESAKISREYLKSIGI